MYRCFVAKVKLDGLGECDVVYCTYFLRGVLLFCYRQLTKIPIRGLC